MINAIKFSAIGILASLILLGGAGIASADDWCARQFRHDQAQLDRAIARHGFNSRQADHARRNIERDRVRCGERFR